MFFFHNEKVFSLSKTADAIPYDDISRLFQELFCYLFVAGLYQESESPHSVVPYENLICKDLVLGSSSYNRQIGKLIAEGLSKRMDVLLDHDDLNETEKKTLERIDTLFSHSGKLFYNLTGKEIVNISLRRNFPDDMKTIAHYVAVSFGQRDFPDSKILKRIYISAFGNIHLSEFDKIKISAPHAIYGRNKDYGTPTALWSLISSMIGGIHDIVSQHGKPGDLLGDILTSLNFLSNVASNDGFIPVTRYASSLYNANRIGIGRFIPVKISRTAYIEFLYGDILYPRDDEQTIKIINFDVLQYILDVMMETSEIYRTKAEMFSSNSEYTSLAFRDDINRQVYRTPSILKFALESLDSEQDDTEEDVQSEDDTDTGSVDSSDDTDIDQKKPDKDLEQDPQTDDNGYDPSNPPPALPTGAPTMEKNTIGILSFDKTGEGVDEDLYRDVVVALNDAFRNDDSIDISADVRDALDQWVNFYLYRTAIAETKKRISSLGLQKYLKNV